MIGEATLPSIDSSVRPIYLDNSGELFCVVDLHDWEWASKWKWKPIRSRGKTHKVYAFRTTRWKGKHVAYFLHKEICFRAHGLPPTKYHIIGDHQDGQSLNNRRSNLEWATSSDNRKNRHGLFAQQTRLALLTRDSSRMLVGAGA